MQIYSSEDLLSILQAHVHLEHVFQPTHFIFSAGPWQVREQHPVQSGRAVDRVGRRGRAAKVVGSDGRQTAHGFQGTHGARDFCRVPS